MTAISIFLALLISLAILRFVYQKLCLKNLDVQLSFSENSATEGDRLILSTVVKNAKWLPLPWVSVKFQISKFLKFNDMQSGQISDDYYRNDLYNLLMYQQITRRFEFECKKRGYFPIKSLDISCWDLFMERKYASNFDCQASITVYPSSIPLDDIDELCTRINGNIQAKRFTYPDPFTFRGIREYSQSDPLKAVNFKASAKVQDLMVNLWDYSVSRQVILMLNLQKQSVWHNEILDEQAIRVAASLARRLTAMHIPVRFISHEIEIPEGAGDTHLNNILEALAHMDVTITPTIPFANVLSYTFNTYQQEPEYWLISTYHGEDIEAAYNRIEGYGVKCAWVIPYSQQVFVNEDFLNRKKIILSKCGG